MLVYHQVVALLLLTLPPDAPVWELQADDALLNALQIQALELGILDRREVRTILAYPSDFESDLLLLRERYAELGNAPPDDDRHRFPERRIINALLEFNEQYREQLEHQLALLPARAVELEEALAENARLHRTWDLLRDAQCDFHLVSVRRQALKQVRELMGEEAYYGGRLPPHIPIWRFQQIQ